MKRRKYHDESTNVSMVSVSRVAGPPQTGQVVLRNSGAGGQRGLAGGEELHIVGGQDRELSVGDRDDAVVGAVDDGDGTAPEPLAGHQPVPEPVVDGAVADPSASSHSMARALAVGMSRPSSQPLLIFSPVPV